MLATSKMKKLDFGPLRPFVTSREALRIVFFLFFQRTSRNLLEGGISSYFEEEMDTATQI